MHLICDQALSLAEPRKAGFDEFRELRDSKRSGAETPMKSSLLEISLRRGTQIELTVIYSNSMPKNVQALFYAGKNRPR